MQATLVNLACKATILCFFTIYGKSHIWQLLGNLDWCVQSGQQT